MTTGPNELSRARAYVDLGRWEDALRELAAVLRTNPDDVEALLLTTTCQLHLARYDDALIAATAAARVRPEYPFTAIARSRALLALKRPRAAREAADYALRLSPQLVAAHLQRINVDAGGRRATAAGKASARAALRLAPNDPNVHVAVGNLSLRQGRRADARRSYREALRLDPESRDAQYSLALVDNLSRGASRPAVQLLKGLIRANPSDPQYEDLLRRMLSGVIVLAGLACAVAATFAAPGGGNPEPTQLRLLLVLSVCIALQAGLLVSLRLLAGRSVYAFLLGIGWRRQLMLVAAGAVVLADLCLGVGILVPAGVAGTLAGIAMVLAFVAIFTVIITAAKPSSR